MKEPIGKVAERPTEVVVRRVLEHTRPISNTPVPVEQLVASKVTVIKHTDDRYLLYAVGIVEPTGDNVTPEGFTEVTTRQRILLLLGFTGNITDEVWGEALSSLENGNKVTFSIVNNRVECT